MEIMISCKNRSSVSAYWRTLTDIVDSINVLELRKRIFGYNKARLYVKVQQKYKPRIQELFEKHSNLANTEIVIQ